MDNLMRVEHYTSERRAQFLLSSAVYVEEHALAVEAERQLGLDPATIPHQPPEDTEA